MNQQTTQDRTIRENGRTSFIKIRMLNDFYFSDSSSISEDPKDSRSIARQDSRTSDDQGRSFRKVFEFLGLIADISVNNQVIYLRGFKPFVSDSLIYQ